MSLSPTLTSKPAAPLSRDINDRAKKSVSEITTGLTSLLTQAGVEIKKRVAALINAPGKPLGTVQFGRGDGYRQQFEHGDMFYLPPNAPCWVRGAILAEYNALGSEGGLLGYPITDERDTPDGTGRYNHFQKGSIYWSYASGAHEIHGVIRDKWASLGWEQGYLGYPITGEKSFTEDGRISQFQKGSICWWPDVGAFDLGDVTLRYRGLYCFGESNEASDADEPYVLMGVVPVPGGSISPPAPVRSSIYEDVDSGDERPDDLELYRGGPFGVALGVAVMEHDEGNPDVYLGLVKNGVDLAGKGVAAACGAIFGPEAAKPCETIWNSAAPMIVSKINDALGTEDDLVGRTNLQITAKEMVLKAREPWQRFWGIRYHWETELITDGDASYKVYFSVEPA